MNFQDCVDILNKRATTICDKRREKGSDSEGNQDLSDACPCISDPNRPKIDFCQVCQPENYKLSESLEVESLSALTDLRMVELIFQIQQKRLQAFQKYDATFLELLETSQIQDYPDLVKHMTEIFNDLSQSILAIKDELNRRIEKSSSTESSSILKRIIQIIQQIQTHEREKLMIVAAIHLHKMQEYLPNVQVVTGGRSEIHENYYTKKSVEIAELINEALEELQASKIDLIELSEDI